MDYSEINNIEIPEEIANKWGNILNLMAEIMEVPAALIMKVEPPYIEVFQTSQNEENPYQIGDREHLFGLYCETVIKSGEKLLITDAESDEDWRENPDIDLGMISYLGFPLRWPDEKIFGTICVLDRKENRYSKKLEQIMIQYKELIESHLKIIYQNREKEVIYNNIEQGICLHEIVYKNNEPVDYRIIDVNSAFEKIFGIPAEKARGSLASELYNTGEAPFLEKYTETAESEKPVTFEEYFPPMEKFFHITVTSPERGKFITLFQDITERKQMEQKIEESNRRISATLKSIGDAVIATDNRGRITLMNSVAEKLTGWESSAAEGCLLKEVFEIVNARTRKKVKNPVKKVMASGKIVGLANHTLLIAKDGKEYQIADSASPIKDNKGKIIGVILVFRDVTEQYKKEQLIRESERKYRILVNRAPVGIFKSTSGGSLISANREIAEILAGDSVTDIINEYKDLREDVYVNPERRDEFLQELRKYGEVNNFKIRAKRIDGTEVWLLLYARISKEHDDGSFIIDGFITDITERERAEKEIEREKNWFKALFENSSDPIVQVDKDHCVVSINQRFEEVFKYKLKEIKGRDLDYVMDIEGKEIADREATRKLLSGQEVTLEGTRYDREGNQVECLIKEVPVVIDGEFAGGYAVYIDITERKKQEEKIRYMSFHDRLTGLYNRAFLEEEIERLDVERELPISLIMADLNGLKIINDSYGHQKGDEMLVKTAGILESSCRSEDIISRWGGDEFILFLPQTELWQAQEIIARIEDRCQRGKEEIPISLALGLGVKERADQDIYKILNRAEEKMYQNKLAEGRSAKSNILNTLLATLGEKSHETQAHARRLEELAFKIGKEINLPYLELDRLSLVASLHDIGKIIVPEDILTKPRKLTKEEWNIIKDHPAAGYRICVNTEEFSHVAKEILSHHERWDGSGYPEGVSGEEIPLLARIISIVDAYDVMTNGRSYKDAMTKKMALTEIERCAGSQFDPELANVFIGIMR